MTLTNYHTEGRVPSMSLRSRQRDEQGNILITIAPSMNLLPLVESIHKVCLELVAESNQWVSKLSAQLSQHIY